METYRRQKDKAMITDQDRWPMWPRLPLKKYPVDFAHPENRLGFMVGTMDPEMDAAPPFTVYVGLLYQPLEEFMDRPDKVKTYTSIDALLDDGWVVD